MKNGWLLRNKRNYKPWGLVFGPAMGLAVFIMAVSMDFSRGAFILFALAVTLVFSSYGLSAVLCRRQDIWGKAAFIYRRVWQVGFCAALAVTVIIQTLIFIHINGDEHIETDVVLVLGAGLTGENPSWILRNRLDAAIAYMERYPDVTAVVSGGQGVRDPIPEALAMYRYMVENGIEPSRLSMEPESRNTGENITYSMSLFPPGTQTVSVVTNGFHLYRAKLLCRRAGLEPVGISAPTPLFAFNVHLHIRETVSVLLAWIGWPWLHL
jgi:uncharacterized SAM-binding protein YcdF (DUF218 family)